MEPLVVVLLFACLGPSGNDRISGTTPFRYFLEMGLRWQNSLRGPIHGSEPVVMLLAVALLLLQAVLPLLLAVLLRAVERERVENDIANLLDVLRFSNRGVETRCYDFCKSMPLYLDDEASVCRPILFLSLMTLRRVYDASFIRPLSSCTRC